MSRYTTAITIRAFDIGNPEVADLLASLDVVYVNSTGKRLEEDDLVRVLEDAEIVIAGTERISRTVIDHAPQLKIISRVGVGLDNIDLGAARERNITVLSTPHSPVTAVAEHTVALILSSLKRIPYLDTCVRLGNSPKGSGSLLSGKSAGIVGMGRIGRKTAGLLEALGCRILWYDPYATVMEDHNRIRYDSIRELMPHCDIVTLHAPAQEDNRPILDQQTLAVCRKGVFIVNTARGSLIDENALLRALDDGTVAGAALDVQSVEPYKGPLIRYQQVILTPHVASNTIESREQMEKEAVTNIIRTLEAMK